MQHFTEEKNEVFLERQGDQGLYIFLLKSDKGLLSQVVGHWQSPCIWISLFLPALSWMKAQQCIPLRSLFIQLTLIVSSFDTSN